MLNSWVNPFLYNEPGVREESNLRFLSILAIVVILFSGVEPFFHFGRGSYENHLGKYIFQE